MVSFKWSPPIYMIGSETHTLIGMKTHNKQKDLINRKYCTLKFSAVVNYAYLIALRRYMPSIADKIFDLG